MTAVAIVLVLLSVRQGTLALRDTFARGAGDSGAAAQDTHEVS